MWVFGIAEAGDTSLNIMGGTPESGAQVCQYIARAGGQQVSGVFAPAGLSADENGFSFEDLGDDRDLATDQYLGKKHVVVSYSKSGGLAVQIDNAGSLTQAPLTAGSFQIV